MASGMLRSLRGFRPLSGHTLRGFDKMVARIRHVLVSRYGEEQADVLVREARQEYAALMPQIPDIGAWNPSLVFFLPTPRYLAMYRTLLRHGGTAEEAGQIAYAMGVAAQRALPRLVRWGIGRLWFSPWFLRRLEERAVESQQRRYPAGSVMRFVAGDQDFDYGIDYLECTTCKYLAAQDAMGLAPYVCALDRSASEQMGWGLTRTMTLAEGCERCDFRFKNGGETRVPVPSSLVSSNI